MIIEGQIVNEDGNNYIKDAEGNTILLYKGIDVTEYVNNGKTYFIEGIYFGIYKGTHEVLPLSVLENDPTAISDVKAEVASDNVIYNLAGQRMSKLSKGINIVNGKKIIK